MWKMTVTERLRQIISLDGWVEEYAALLSNVSFRRLFGARVVSLVGDNLYIVAAMWLVFELTGSTLFTGIAAFLGRVPRVLSFLAGPVVDSYNPRRILVATEVVQFGLILIVPAAAAAGHLEITLLLTVMFCVAVANQLAGPAQDAVLPRIVDENRLTRANSVFTFTRRTTEAGTRAVAGFAVGLFGVVATFGINAATFAVGAVLFRLVDVPQIEQEESEAVDSRFAEYMSDVRKGFAVILNSPAITVVAGTAIANLLAGASFAVLPAYAATFSGTTMSVLALTGSSAYGILYAGVGAGLLIGATVASKFEHLTFRTVTLGLFGWTGVVWVGAILLKSLLATAVLFALAWAAIGVYNILAVSILQKGVPNELIGRVFATSDSASNLLRVAGILSGGALGELLSPGDVMISAGSGFLLVGVYWLVSPGTERVPSVSDTETGTFGLDTD